MTSHGTRKYPGIRTLCIPHGGALNVAALTPPRNSAAIASSSRVALRAPEAFSMLRNFRDTTRAGGIVRGRVSCGIRRRVLLVATREMHQRNVITATRRAGEVAFICAPLIAAVPLSPGPARRGGRKGSARDEPATEVEEITGLRRSILRARFATALRKEGNPPQRPVTLHSLAGPATSGAFSVAVTERHRATQF